MPGLVGVASTKGREDARERFARATARMLRHAGVVLESASALDGACLVGQVVLPHVSEERAARLSGPPVSPLVVVHGTLYNGGALQTELNAPGAPLSPEQIVAALYQEYGAAFVEHLEGEFAVCLVDVSQHLVLVATDRTASHLVRWHADANGLVFASDLSAVLEGSSARRRLNLRAVADYLTAGAIFGDKTLAEDVYELGPGTILRYDVDARRVSLHQYANQADLFEPKVSSRGGYLDALEAAFAQAVNRAVRGTPGVGLSLSGGLDSRAILATLNGRGADLQTYTLGVAGCADHAIANRLSALAGSTHHSFVLDASYLRDFLPNMARMVSITDGMYLSHGLTEMLALRFLEETGIRVLLRGHGGELAKTRLAWPLHTDAHVYELRSTEQLVPYLSARANYVTPALPLTEVLTPAAAASAGRGSADSFAEALTGVTLTPAECCSYLYLRELHHRFTAPSLDLFRTRVEVRQPFVDPSFLKVLLAAPPEWRDDTSIHQRLTGAHAAMLSVRNSNTGARADAGPLAEYILDKANTALRRLNVPGYRHYHNFEGWMRQSLLESVESRLLASETPTQIFVAPATVRSLIDRTRSGASDHAYLLQVLLILDLWQRENSVEAAT